MNQTKTAKRLLTILIAAAAMSLAACGGGTSSNDPAGVLAAGAVGTKGDGVNASEYAALACGMNKDQVQAIIGDAPTTDKQTSTGSGLMAYAYPNTTYTVSVGLGDGGLLINKVLNQGSKSIDQTICK